jgi:adenosyl cobinamide kinase/adenosyl cobinamide phosphate guanylyltransferase
MRMKMTTNTFRSKRDEYESNIKMWEKRLNTLQEECPHDKDAVLVTNMVGYKMIYSCNNCGKNWKEGDLD